LDNPTAGTEAASESEPSRPTDSVDVDSDGAPEAALIAAAPDVLAGSLSEFVAAWWRRIRAGESGALPILLGLLVIIVIFQVQQPKFLSAGNIVNLLVQAAFFILLGLAEIYALLLSEIDLSVGFVGAVGAAIVAALISPPYNWPWWAGVIVGLAATAVIGALQGTLITRLHLPSFVVTLAGLLGWAGVLIFIFDSDKGAVGGVISISSNKVIYNLVNGNMSPVTSWILLVVLVGLFALFSILKTVRRRSQGLSAPPLSITIATIVLAAAAGVALVIVCNINRGVLVPLRGVPWVIPFVLAVVAAASLLLSRTRTGRYIYAIGGSPEAARRAGINVSRIRTIAFTLASFTAGPTSSTPSLPPSLGVPVSSEAVGRPCTLSWEGS
jgi:D-xylose transport system permease protein